MNWIDWLRIVVEVIVVIIGFFAGRKKERSSIAKRVRSMTTDQHPSSFKASLLLNLDRPSRGRFKPPSGEVF